MRHARLFVRAALVVAVGDVARVTVAKVAVDEAAPYALKRDPAEGRGPEAFPAYFRPFVVFLDCRTPF